MRYGLAYMSMGITVSFPYPFTSMKDGCMDNYLRVGVIASTHGIRGEVKVYVTTDDKSRFSELDSVYLDTGRELMHLEIEGVKYFKQFAILKFKGIDNINDIEKYRGKDLLITRQQAVNLEEDEYFIYDLLGMEVFADTGERIGELAEILTSPANDVYVVKTPEGKEVLLPSIKECILDIDEESKRIIVHMMDGL